jgi:hypothetical protein
MRKSIRASTIVLLVSWARPAVAEEIAVESVLSRLKHPTSVAIRPGGTADAYEVFVAESGARRVFKISSNEPSRPVHVITDFPGAPGELVPSGYACDMLFLDDKHLVVGIHDEPSKLLLYDLAEAGNPLTAGSAKQRVTPEASGRIAESIDGPPVGLTRTRSNDSVADVLLVAIFGSGVWKVPIRANMLGEMSRLEIQSQRQVMHPATLTVSEQGYVLAWNGPLERGGDARLMFVNPVNGQVALEFETDIQQIEGMAYSPKSGNLFAVARTEADNEGLFRIDDARTPGEQKIAVTKLANIARPTALAFGPEGALYVTTVGEATEDGGGKLLKITGSL